MAVFGEKKLLILALGCMLQGLQLIGAEKGTKVTEIAECPAGYLSISPAVKSYECSGPPSFRVGTPYPATSGGTKSDLLSDQTFTFALSTNLVFTAVTTCPEQVTAAMTCNQLKVSFGTGAQMNDGSMIEIKGTGYPGLAWWKCTEGSVTVYYYFFIDFSGAAGTSPSGSDAETSLSALQDINADSTGAPVAGVDTDFKPKIFQKFNEVDENTVVYYVKTSTASHIIFKSTETTVTFMAGDYARFTPAFTSPTVATTCDDAVKIKFSGSTKLSFGSFLMLIPFVLFRFN